MDMHFILYSLICLHTSLVLKLSECTATYTMYRVMHYSHLKRWRGKRGSLGSIDKTVRSRPRQTLSGRKYQQIFYTHKILYTHKLSRNRTLHWSAAFQQKKAGTDKTFLKSWLPVTSCQFQEFDWNAVHSHNHETHNTHSVSFSFN